MSRRRRRAAAQDAPIEDTERPAGGGEPLADESVVVHLPNDDDLTSPVEDAVAEQLALEPPPPRARCAEPAEEPGGDRPDEVVVAPLEPAPLLDALAPGHAEEPELAPTRPEADAGGPAAKAASEQAPMEQAAALPVPGLGPDPAPVEAERSAPVEPTPAAGLSTDDPPERTGPSPARPRVGPAPTAAARRASGPGAGAGVAPPPAGGTDPVVAGALRSIVVPDYDASFWDDLADQLADEPQLRLRPRAAVRPITQPPPVTEDRLRFDDGDIRPGGWRRSRRRGRRHRGRRLLMWLVLIAAIVAGVAAVLQDDAGSTGGVGAGTASAEGRASSTTATPANIDPLTGLTPAGVGPLTVGSTLADLEAAGVPAIAVVSSTFAGTGGTCFDATVTGIADLTLRFRSPRRDQGVSDPAEGVLGAIEVGSRGGSLRSTPTGIAVGATEDQLRVAYPDGLTQIDYPDQAARVFTATAGDGGRGIAFITDGTAVTRILVGATDLIGYLDGCP